MTQTNMQIHIEVVLDEGGVFEKKCDSIAEAVQYLEGLKTKEKYHAITF